MSVEFSKILEDKQLAVLLDFIANNPDSVAGYDDCGRPILGKQIKALHGSPSVIVAEVIDTVPPLAIVDEKFISPDPTPHVN